MHSYSNVGSSSKVDSLQNTNPPFINEKKSQKSLFCMGIGVSLTSAAIVTSIKLHGRVTPFYAGIATITGLITVVCHIFFKFSHLQQQIHSINRINNNSNQNDLDHQIKGINVQLSGHMSLFDDLNNKIDSISNSLKSVEKNEQLEEFNKKIDSFSKTLESLKDQIDLINKEEKVSQLKEELTNTFQKQIDELNNSLLNLKKDFTTPQNNNVEESIDSLKQQIESIGKQFENLNSQIDSIKIEKKVSQLEDELKNAFQHQIDELNTSLSNLNKNLTTPQNNNVEEIISNENSNIDLINKTQNSNEFVVENSNIPSKYNQKYQPINNINEFLSKFHDKNDFIKEALLIKDAQSHIFALKYPEWNTDN
ncbi:MAG: hypothetical protein Q8K60_01795, partial [Parachlamydiaceae bacterium]|nr:hypothetical protein [Parachlamydiaceae bacterium]